MACKLEGEEMYPIFDFANFWSVHSKVSSVVLAWKECAQKTKKNPFPHKLCSFMSSSSACPASSASIASIINLLEAESYFLRAD